MKKSKLSKRITWRVIVIMLCFNVLIIAAILVFVFGYSLANSGMRGQYVTDGIDGRLESSVKAVKIAARNNVEEVEDNLDTPQTVFDALEHELRLNNSYIGFAAAFEPNYYPSEGYWFEPYVIYTDSNNNDTIEAGEKCQITFDVENNGNKAITNITPILELTAENKGIKIGNPRKIGRLSAKGKITYSVPVNGTSHLKDGVAEFRAYVIDDYGNTSDSREFTLPTKK